jgi:hypothetical protein
MSEQESQLRTALAELLDALKGMKFHGQVPEKIAKAKKVLRETE